MVLAIQLFCAGFEPRRGCGITSNAPESPMLGSREFCMDDTRTERLKTGACKPKELGTRSARRVFRPTGRNRRFAHSPFRPFADAVIYRLSLSVGVALSAINIPARGSEFLGFLL